MDSGSSKHFIGPELIHGVESRMLEYTEVEPPMEIRAAGNNMLHGTAQVLVVVRGTDDVLRKVKLPIVLVPDLKRSLLFNLATAQKGVKTVIERMGRLSTLDRLVFS